MLTSPSAKSRRYPPGGPRPWALDMLRRGLTMAFVAEQLGVSIDTILTWAQAGRVQLAATPPVHPWRPPRDPRRDEVLSLLRDGLCLPDVLKRVPVNRRTVRLWAREEGVPIKRPPPTPAQRWRLAVARHQRSAASAAQAAQARQEGIRTPWELLEERRSRAEALLLLGQRDSEVAAALGVSHKTARRWRVRLGLPIVPRVHPARAEAVKLRAEGLSFREIGRRLGVGAGSVRRWTREEADHTSP